MERESFCSLEVAKVLNEHFVPIEVDREARPDIDEIYINYITAATGSGSWPLNVFLTPDLEPVFGGTYRHGPGNSTLPRLAAGFKDRLTFLDILVKMRGKWTTQQQRSAKEITQQLKEFAAEGSHLHLSASLTDKEEPKPLDLDVMDDAFDHFASRYGPAYGGFTSTSPAPNSPLHPA